MITLVNGSVELKDQLRDYEFRGKQLEPMGFLDFILETYETANESKEDEAGGHTEVLTDDATEVRGPGRPRSTRIAYQKEAGKPKMNCCWIVRQPGHETLPRIVGKWFSRSDNDSETEFFKASMLMLLKPWRRLHELKTDGDTFEIAFEAFMSQANEKCHRVVANVQYYYECFDGAKREREKVRSSTQVDQAESVDIGIGIDYEEVNRETVRVEIVDEDIERVLLMRTLPRERLYAQAAVGVGYDVGFFKDDEMGVICGGTARRLQADEGDKIKGWELELKAATWAQIKINGTTNTTEEPGPCVSPVGQTGVTKPGVQRQGNQKLAQSVEESHTRRHYLAILNEEQQRAHDIIEERLKDHIKSE